MTLTTSGMCIFKAGKGVNENFYSGMSILVGGLSGQTIDFLISGATATVNDFCTKNWSDIYTGLDGDLSGILSDTVSSLVAIELVKYDMSGYTSRVEAEDIINVLRDSVLRNLGILRDKEVQEFIE